MRVLRIHTLCVAATLILGLAVAWLSAIPRQMSQSRLDMTGGVNCSLSACSAPSENCSEALSGCTGTMLGLETKCDSTPKNYISEVIEGETCGGGTNCDKLRDSKCSTDCTPQD
ncbi:MAG: hypothetical protein JSU94_07010 [Phycisphaerales bacterium]|nr:MAG: hypothetical protein JSU94_07010 [Phycisphaerales bacterium]